MQKARVMRQRVEVADDLLALRDVQVPGGSAEGRVSVDGCNLAICNSGGVLMRLRMMVESWFAARSVSIRRSGSITGCGRLQVMCAGSERRATLVHG